MTREWTASKNYPIMATALPPFLYWTLLHVSEPIRKRVYVLHPENDVPPTQRKQAGPSVKPAEASVAVFYLSGDNSFAQAQVIYDLYAARNKTLIVTVEHEDQPADRWCELDLSAYRYHPECGRLLVGASEGENRKRFQATLLHAFSMLTLEETILLDDWKETKQMAAKAYLDNQYRPSAIALRRIPSTEQPQTVEGWRVWTP